MTTITTRVAALATLSFGLSACVVPNYAGQGGVVVPVVQPIVQPVQIDVRTPNRVERVENPNAPIYVCTLKPFMDEYRSENRSRGQAKLNVQKQCRAKVDAMFCEEKDIVCKTYE